MQLDEYINKVGNYLLQTDKPVFELAKFYCTLYGISVFKELYPALGKLTKQFGIGKVYKAIIDNYYKNIKYNKEHYYRDLIFAIKRMEKSANVTEPTPITYAEYTKLRESVNV